MLDKESNAQSWELEIICKNKKYLKRVTKSLLKYGMMNFKVSTINFDNYHGGTWDGRYSVLINCSWFNNLADLSNDLAKIEEELEN